MARFTMVSLFFIVLFVLCLAFSMNMQLGGTVTEKMEVILGFAVLGWVVAGLFILNWEWAIIGIVAAIVFVGLTQPIGKWIARTLTGRPT